ncbi:MAG: hypothetical protein K6U74_06930 [Firmicutes bacterium]|nr:hypothetical protein [Bacillota bacterium]
MDEEMVKDLLYQELMLEVRIREIQEELSAMAERFKVLSEALKNPLEMNFGGSSAPIVFDDKHKPEFNSMEFDRLTNYYRVKELVQELKEKVAILEDVKKRLYPVRNPQKILKNFTEL